MNMKEPARGGLFRRGRGRGGLLRFLPCGGLDEDRDLCVDRPPLAGCEGDQAGIYFWSEADAAGDEISHPTAPSASNPPP